jgi:hypothetical protein
MKSALSMIALGVALAATCGSPATVHAGDGIDASDAGLRLGSKTVSLDVLDGQRGGADAHLSDIRAVGSVSDVKAFDLVTGNNVVTEGSLAGASGLPMLIQNSGNGVLIQNAVILNVEVK